MARNVWQPGGDRILVGGYSVLIHKMVEIVGPDTIKCDRAVAAIDRSSDGVAVRCVNGEVFTADAAVITVPLGILKRTAGEAGHVAFSPPLPESKLGAIGRGRMSCLNKLFLIFDECHWPKDQYSFAYINETRTNRRRPNPRPARVSPPPRVPRASAGSHSQPPVRAHPRRACESSS